MLLHFHQTRTLVLGAIAVFVLFAVLLTDSFNPPRTTALANHLSQQTYSYWHSTASKTRWRDLADVWIGRKDPARIVLASVLYDDQPEDNELLERALLTHEKHAERWGYATTVLRKKLVDGWWGKWVWLQALVTMELNKNGTDAAEWIMFLGPTAVLNDPTIPLSLFLPPNSITTNMTSSHSPSDSHSIPLDDVHFLGAYDPSSPITANPDYPAVSTAAFFLRVHPWTMAFLQHLLAQPLLDSGVADEDFALAKTLADITARDLDGFAHVVLQPERWRMAGGCAPPSTSRPAWAGRRWKGLTDAVAAVEKGRVDRAYPFGFADAGKSVPAGRKFYFFFSSAADADVSVPRALVEARALDRAQSRPPPEAGQGPLEAWDFWERIARGRAVLQEAEEVRAQWDRERPGQVDGDDAWKALVELLGKLEGAMSWGAGRKRVLEEAVEEVRGVMYGRGKRVEDGG
ncbi:galactosyl transferase gma12 mnn10 family protein [Botryosphaeria dothidea]|uniref:Galactosyl transferase gma12 mnn10 family protein n=1 Tax=Botryosphaeria dothidea TaxID=55169 RepID=A0A8H4N3D5_9PEZI|nr:galactosyl transferase gma12 mnn10 family protein [Botryosphaeria dothidea]